MASYRFLVQQLSGYFEGCEFHHVPRANNEAPDALSKLGSTRQAIPPGISMEHIKKPSIKPSPESESIFISETDLEALKQDNLVQPPKVLTLKKQPDGPGAAASTEPAAPGAADCIPRVVNCSKAKKSDLKAKAIAPGAIASSESMAPGAADCNLEAPTPKEQLTVPESSSSAKPAAPGAADCK